jgi:hypothetical protein|tara:strand:+ start:3489 stop:3767 length:279 start_codon:yes stop_codon:yes gene_type:complete
MPSDNDNFDDTPNDGKVIDIKDYVSNKANKANEETEIDMFTSQFVAMINQTIAEKQQKESRFQYLYVMINSILFTLVFVIASILFIFIKLYF